MPFTDFCVEFRVLEGREMDTLSENMDFFLIMYKNQSLES